MQIFGANVLEPSLAPWGGILVRMLDCGKVMAGVVPSNAGVDAC